MYSDSKKNKNRVRFLIVVCFDLLNRFCRWKDLLPEVLNVLVERETFTYEELEYTGAEYKTDYINTLCMTNWSPSIVINLTAAFM